MARRVWVSGSRRWGFGSLVVEFRVKGLGSKSPRTSPSSSGESSGTDLITVLSGVRRIPWSLVSVY